MNITSMFRSSYHQNENSSKQQPLQNGGFFNRILAYLPTIFTRTSTQSSSNQAYRQIRQVDNSTSIFELTTINPLQRAGTSYKEEDAHYKISQELINPLQRADTCSEKEDAHSKISQELINALQRADTSSKEEDAHSKISQELINALDQAIQCRFNKEYAYHNISKALIKAKKYDFGIIIFEKTIEKSSPYDKDNRIFACVELLAQNEGFTQAEGLVKRIESPHLKICAYQIIKEWRVKSLVKTSQFDKAFCLAMEKDSSDPNKYSLPDITRALLIKEICNGLIAKKDFQTALKYAEDISYTGEINCLHMEAMKKDLAQIKREVESSCPNTIPKK